MRDPQLPVEPQRDNVSTMILVQVFDNFVMFLNIPRETIRRKKRVQELLPGDSEKCIRFWQWIINAAEIDRQHLKMILWTDEAPFSRRGLLNVRNEYAYAHENPYANIHRDNVGSDNISLEIVKVF